MRKFRTCFVLPLFYSSTLLSFIVLILFPVNWILCIGQYFTSVSWQWLNDPNIKPSEIFKVEQKKHEMGITGFWLTLYNSRLIYHWQSTDIPPTVNGQRIGTVSAAISADSWTICRPTLGPYCGRFIGWYCSVKAHWLCMSRLYI